MEATTFEEGGTKGEGGGGGDEGDLWPLKNSKEQKRDAERRGEKAKMSFSRSP